MSSPPLNPEYIGTQDRPFPRRERRSRQSSDTKRTEKDTQLSGSSPTTQPKSDDFTEEYRGTTRIPEAVFAARRAARETLQSEQSR